MGSRPINLALICPVPTGMKEFFFSGRMHFEGMPAFQEVFLRLLEDQRVGQILLFVPLGEPGSKKLHLPERYTDRVVLHEVYYNRSTPIRSVMSLTKLALRIARLHQSGKIDRVAGFRPEGTWPAALAGKISGVPNFRRLYGTFLINEISQPKLTMLCRHPLEVSSLSLGGGRVLITNDGTRGDVVYKKYGSDNNDFYFPLNGVDLPETDTDGETDVGDRYMCYIARICNWKGQKKLVEALHILHERRVRFPRAIIVGQPSEQHYYEELLEMIGDYGLQECVTVIPGLPKDECMRLSAGAEYVFSLYHTSNLGNVFLESIRGGAAMIALNDTGSLDRFPKEIYYEVRKDSPVHVANAIEDLETNMQRIAEIKEAAFAYGERELKSWAERAELEVNIILGHDRYTQAL